ncbi:DUF2127 domain-containing protein [Ostreiculturibacter nitratireducens]|uniref:DUF2127 domain-containing protein n=1 Tax=Ostreiculturibacter nitratireducens TaxID=3075226 RepID=UPI0031B5D448
MSNHTAARTEEREEPEPPRKRRNRVLHEVFELSIGLKALFAASELISGIGIYLIPSGWVLSAARWLTAKELIEDPTDRLAQWLLGLAQHFSIATQDFWAAYLVGHAAVKLAVVAGLLLRIRWAYPASIWVLVGFIVYQADRWFQDQSVTMILLSIFDLVVIWLIWHEYREMKAKAGPET